MFEDKQATQEIERLAKQEAAARLRYKQLKTQAQAAEAEAEACAERLVQTMQAAGMKSCKLECGLTPSWSEKWKVWRAAEVDPKEFNDWHKKHGLGHLVREITYTHTNEATQEYERWIHEHGKLPAKLFNAGQVATLRMTGRSNYEDTL